MMLFQNSTPAPSCPGGHWLSVSWRERGDGIFEATLCPLAPSCRCCSIAVLGLHGVSLKLVAGSMPGLLPPPWQCSKSLRHLPLMNHPNGSSDYVRLQFGPQPRATPLASSLTRSLCHLPFPSQRM